MMVDILQSCLGIIADGLLRGLMLALRGLSAVMPRVDHSFFNAIML